MAEEEGRVVKQLVGQLEDLRGQLEAAEAREAGKGSDGNAGKRAKDEGGREGSEEKETLSSQEYEEIIMKMKDEVDDLEEELSEQKKL